MASKWTPIVKSVHNTSVYDPFQNSLCIFVDKRGDIRLSRASFAAINKPKFVTILSDGNGNIGFQRAEAKSSEAFTVGYGGSGLDSRIACKSVTQDRGLVPVDGVVRFVAYMDGDILVVNTKQKSQKIR
jgi:hypothetical protein